MPVIDVQTDTDALTLTITAEFAAPVERVWEVYENPRRLEKVWGPPEYPATFVEHDFTPGGRATYYMTSPEGEKFGGWWRFETIDPMSSFTFEDGFADAELKPLAGMPVSQNRYVFEATDSGTRAVFTSTYESAENLQKVLEMGIIEGASAAINQIDDLLAA
ncbi:SRPBCC domain-containing protein [Gordonia sihwensis]|uniref:SRPBCC family protein n=1 Tax=Gordonia TaxID=2053 RepID=UPI002417FC8B|nr:SRPBCC domain-containing protein [Gordonia sihwensis]WFN93972.1 SRPBCC domain-containing protein [Gordonia sihwensis]